MYFFNERDMWSPLDGFNFFNFKIFHRPGAGRIDKGPMGSENLPLLEEGGYLTPSISVMISGALLAG